MSSLTTNLKLVKPELHDNITPTIFADNFDKIDAALEGVSGGALSLEEIEASTNLDGKIPSAAALKEVNNSIGELSNSFQASFEYSTDERIVGTWIDGSPIYRKVFTGTIQDSAEVIIGNIPSLSRLVNIYGATKSISNEYIPLNFFVDVHGTPHYNHAYVKPNGDISIFTVWPGPYNCIVEYIK